MVGMAYGYGNLTAPYATTVSVERGNVLFLVLIGVILFAALSFAIMSSSRSGGKDISEDKAKMAASEILQHFADIKQGIDRVRMVNKCSVEEISFSSLALVMTNSSSPSNRRCHVFFPEGGGVSRVKFNPKFFDATKFQAGALWVTYGFGPYSYFVDMNASNRQLNIGTHTNGVASVDLLGMLYGVSNNVCKAINKMVGYNAPTYAPITKALYVNAAYTGVFTDSSSYPLEVPVACVYNGTYNANFVTFPLIER